MEVVWMVYLVEETSLAEDYKEKLMLPAYHLDNDGCPNPQISLFLIWYFFSQL